MALLNYTGKNLMGVCLASGDIVRLMPGINEVDEASLKQIMSHPLFKHKVDTGKVTVMADKLDKDGKRSIDEMLNNIPKIFDTKLLKNLINTDGRDKVVRAAEAQLDRIKNPAKFKAEDEHFA